MNTCKHYDPPSQECLVVYQLTFTPYEPTPEDCQACGRCSNPQTVNEITGLISNNILIELGKPTLYSGKGLGTRLAKVFDWFVRIPPNCDCEDRTKIMDAWGVEGCRLNKRTILHWLRESAYDNDIPYSEIVISAALELLFIIPTFQTRIPS